MRSQLPQVWSRIVLSPFPARGLFAFRLTPGLPQLPQV